MQQYQEGQRLQGSDGYVYIVSNGVPTREQAQQPQSIITKRADPYAAQIQQQQLLAAQQRNQAAPADVDKAQADARRSAFDARNQAGQQKFEREDKLRADYLGLPSVKNYTQALPVYAAGLSSKPDGAGDLNLIYAYAKVMDPNSVVREGEQASVANSDSWINSTTANLQKQLGFGGTFKPEFRKRLREEMAGRMGQLNQSFVADRVDFKRNALSVGVDPVNVVGRHPAEKFKALQERVLGRKAPELDFDGNAVVTGGATKDVPRKDRQDALTTLIRGNADIATINSVSRAFGGGDVSAAEVDAMRAYIKKNPDFKGPLVESFDTTPTNTLNQIAAGPVGAYGANAVNAFTGNNLDAVAGLLGADPRQVRSDLNQVSQDGPGNQFASFLGNVTGAGAATYGLTRGATALGARAIPAMYGANTAYGGISGASGSDNSNPLVNGVLGAAAGFGGTGVGQAVGEGVAALSRTAPVAGLVDSLRSRFGMSAIAREAPLSRGESLVARAGQEAGPDVTQQLTEAANLGLPMTPADASPQFARLAGNAVRYSPEAEGQAQAMFAARNRGQVDRFRQGVERDLGPVADIPQTSADLMQQARTAAAPLYDVMRATPGRTSEALDGILATDFGKEALGKAKAIANAKQKDPNKMGFGLNDQGETALVDVPSGETIDYVKRGMDQVLEQYRSPLTGKMNFEGNPLAAAQNDLRQSFIREADALNPAYADARRAFAGPASAKDALLRGKDSYRVQPDQLRMNVAQQSPADLAQMQLGYRGAMVDAAEGARYQANPYDATLGSPTQVERLRVMNQGNPNVDRLVRQAELERQMQRTSNGIVGNSATQGRNVADQAFLDQNALPALAVDGATMLAGGIPVASAGRQIAARGLRDFSMGMTRNRATRTANEMAPYLLNDDPAAAASSVADLIARNNAYRAYVDNSRRNVVPMGMFGGSVGVSLAPR